MECNERALIQRDRIDEDLKDDAAALVEEMGALLSNFLVLLQVLKSERGRLNVELAK